MLDDPQYTHTIPDRNKHLQFHPLADAERPLEADGYSLVNKNKITTTAKKLAVH